MPAASCHECSGKISFVEGHCARSMFKVHRIKGGYPTRRPKDRPKNLPVTFVTGEKEVSISVPVKHYPNILIMPIFQPPGMLRGLKPSMSWDDMKIVGEIQKPSKIIGADSFKTSVDFNPRTFTRLLAKIAHCVAVVRYGVDGFRPFLIKHILEDDPYAPHLIGGDGIVSSLPLTSGPDPELEYELAMCTITSDQKERVILVKIRLFGYKKTTPIYNVITGIASSAPRLFDQ